MLSKICSHCKIEKIINHFSKNKHQSDGYKNQCKECIKEYYNLNKGKLLGINKQYREDNKERLSDIKKQYYKDNKEKLNNNVKEWVKNNKIRYDENRGKYIENNKEAILNYSDGLICASDFILLLKSI